jgi:ribosome assembly protein 1
VLDEDPFFKPTTEEEREEHGEAEVFKDRNFAFKCIHGVRKRKGLFTEDKLIEFAEKQRTRTKNK